jgi:hypothetical protein
MCVYVSVFVFAKKKVGKARFHLFTYGKKVPGTEQDNDNKGLPGVFRSRSRPTHPYEMRVFRAGDHINR